MIWLLLFVLSALAWCWYQLPYATRYTITAAFWLFLAGAALAGTILACLTGGRVFVPAAEALLSVQFGSG